MRVYLFDKKVWRLILIDHALLTFEYFFHQEVRGMKNSCHFLDYFNINNTTDRIDNKSMGYTALEIW